MDKWLLNHSAVWFQGGAAYHRGVAEYWNPYVYLADSFFQWSAGWHWAREVGGLWYK